MKGACEIAFAALTAAAFHCAAAQGGRLADYRVRAGGDDVAVVKCRQSAHPFNRVWRGRQRPIDQTEESAYASLVSSGPVEVAVTLPPQFEGAAPTVRPLSAGIRAERSERIVRFVLPGPGQYVFEPEGDRHNALQLFVNPPLRKPDWRWTRQFGPGEHFAGLVELKSGDRIYVDPQAVVHGGFGGKGVKDVKIFGTGRIVSDVFERGPQRGVWRAGDEFVGSCNFALCGSSDVSVEGLVFENSALWSVAVFDCDRVEFDNVKVVGQWRYNADGIDICNSRDVTVRNSFVHAFDDVITVKGRMLARDRPLENVLATNCVLWCDWGRTCEIGIETWAKPYRNVAFVDCDCIHNSASVLDVQAGGDTEVEDVLFSGIRVEYERYIEPEVGQSRDDAVYSADGREGNPYLVYIDNHKAWDCFFQAPYSGIRGVKVKDVTVYLAAGRPKPPTWIKNVDPRRPLGQYGEPLGPECANPNGKMAEFVGIDIDEPRFVTVK